MNYKLLIAGLIFLFNPDINILDLLPDFIGFFMIASAIAPIAPISPSAEDAIKALRKLGWVSLIKLAVFIPLVSVASSDPAFYLIFTSSFAIVYMIYLFPAFNGIFDAIDHFSGKYGIVLRGAGFTKVATLVFFSVRLALACAPELVYLYNSDNTIYDTVLYPLAVYKMPLVVIGATLSLIVGTIWLIIASRFFTSLRKNKRLCEAVSIDVSQITYSKKQIVTSNIGTVVMLTSLSLLPFIGYNIEGTPVFPLFLLPVILLFDLKYVKRITLIEKKASVFHKISLAFTLISYIAILLFCYKYHKVASVGAFLARDKFYPVAILELISLLLCSVSFIIHIGILKKIVSDHTGKYWEKDYISHNSTVAKEKQSQLNKLTLSSVSSVIIALINAISYALIYLSPEIRLITALISLAWTIAVGALLSSIKLSVIEKYADEK